MRLEPSPIRRAAVFACLVLALAAPARAAEENEAALSKIVELNKKALVAYDSLEMETASALLHQALNVCKKEGLEHHPAAARTHLHLGVVYISGLKFPELGLAEFREALTIDPKIQIAKSQSNPEVQAAFAEAQSPDAAPGATGKRVPFPTGQEPPAGPASDAAPSVARINHPPVTHASQGQAIEIKAQVPPGMGAAKVVLAYRGQDADDFLAREMTPSEGVKGWVHESIPAEATRGAWVAYYIEAQDADDQTVAQNGSPEAPRQITLVPEHAADELRPGATGGPGKARGKAGLGRGLWMVLALGSGGGYHRGSPEMNPKDASGHGLTDSGFGTAQLLHLAPEIGYFQRDNLILSAQGRFQYVTGTQDVHIGQKTYHPAVMAFAGLAKVTWIPSRPGRRFQPFGSAMVGAGQIRHGITTPASANLTGCGSGPTCQDTVLGGLGLLGVGAGFRYRLTEGFGFYLAVNLLAGLPHFMVNGDLNAGFVLVR
jgi:hypothetical protein